MAKPRNEPAQTDKLAEIDERIAIARDNLRELTEQAAAFAGGSTEEALQDRITEQETKLRLLREQREALVRGKA